MNEYLVHPFHIHETDQRAVLVTAQSVIKLGDPAFRQMLSRLHADRVCRLDEAMLQHRTTEQQLPHEPTREFLLNSGILQRLGLAGERLSLVRIESTHSPWGEMLCNHLSGVEATTSPAPAARDQATKASKGFELRILLLLNYSEARIARFYEQLPHTPQASGLIVYFRSRTLCVSSVYTPAYRTPCHFCHVGWESRATAVQGARSASLSGLMRSFEDMGETELPAAPLNALDWPVACAFLVNHIQRLAGVGSPKLLQEAITTRHEFDLQSFVRLQHVAVHWPGCDCQYREVSPS